MWNKELGKYMIDVSKYFLTAIFAMSLMKDLEDKRWLIYILSGSVALLLLVCGLILTRDKDKEEEEKKKRNNNINRNNKQKTNRRKDYGNFDYFSYGRNPLCGISDILCYV